MPDFSEAEKNTIQVVSIAASALGLTGALLMILMFATHKNIRSFSYRLILYLAISDAGEAISFIIGPKSHSALVCEIQATFRSLFALSSVLWIDVIAYVMYKSIVDQHEDMKRYECRLMLGVIGYAGLASLVPIVTNSYSETVTGYCWLSEN